MMNANYAAATERFKPRYPLNPFDDDADDDATERAIPRDPWSLDTDRVPPLELTRLQTSVILIIGSPTVHQLLPLCTSPHLASSLLVIAAYDTVRFPPMVRCCIRVLKLREPLAVESSGAERLVRTLEWAERIARVWRAKGGDGIMELSEPDDMVSLAASAVSKKDIFGATTYSPLSSSSLLVATRGTVPNMSSNTLPTRGASLKTRRSSKIIKPNTFLPPRDPYQRPFDALVNFLPATGIPDGLLLKNTILVTTISRSFMTSEETVDEKSSVRKKPQSVRSSKKRWSLFRSSTASQVNTDSSVSSSNASLLSAPRLGYASSFASHKSHDADANGRVKSIRNSSPPLLIHILPSPPLHPHDHVYTQKQLAARGKLVRSVESFLLAFGASSLGVYNSSDSKLGMTMKAADKRAFAVTGPLDMQRARPYIVDGSSFANDVIMVGGDDQSDTAEWSLAELLVFGCLDPDPSVTTRRAWLSGVSDIVFKGYEQAGHDQNMDGTVGESERARTYSTSSSDTEQGTIQFKVRGRAVEAEIATLASVPPAKVNDNANGQSSSRASSSHGHSQEKHQQGRQDWAIASPSSITTASSPVSPSQYSTTSPSSVTSSPPLGEKSAFSSTMSSLGAALADESPTSVIASSSGSGREFIAPQSPPLPPIPLAKTIPSGYEGEENLAGKGAWGGHTPRTYPSHPTMHDSLQSQSPPRPSKSPARKTSQHQPTASRSRTSASKRSPSVDHVQPTLPPFAPAVRRPSDAGGSQHFNGIRQAQQTSPKAHRPLPPAPSVVRSKSNEYPVMPPDGLPSESVGMHGDPRLFSPSARTAKSDSSHSYNPPESSTTLYPSPPVFPRQEHSPALSSTMQKHAVDGIPPAQLQLATSQLSNNQAVNASSPQMRGSQQLSKRSASIKQSMQNGELPDGASLRSGRTAPPPLPAKDPNFVTSQVRHDEELDGSKFFGRARRDSKWKFWK